MARLLYFANLRERAGRAEETLHLPPHVKTGRHLLRWLSEEKPDLADILANGKIRIALDQELAPLDAAIGDAKEIALFPPMTGG
jgi:molybdopterin synthase sulfur carrier subunit